MKKQKQRTAVYVRESGWPPDGLSLAEQISFIRKYARKRGFKFVKAATDGKA